VFFQYSEGGSNSVATFTLYVKRKSGSKDLADKAILLLQGYLSDVVKKSADFTDAKAVLVEDGTTPSLVKTDVIVYVVKNPEKGIIKAQNGDISMAANNDKILGLTDLNKKICEIYYERVYPESSKEFSGACYHEAAHIKSNLGNSMHTGKNGFLKDSPDYNGSPTIENNDFLAKHLNRDVSMTSSY
jgi:hypothetical protein